MAPMAGMTDSAFRRLVKRHGGCGLVVTEMVSSEGLVRGIDRTLEYAEYTEEERPVSIQIFGGDPEKMAAAAQIVEGMGADIVDVNMGCPVPKISKHNAGCSLMREPAHAASVVRSIARAVKIPVTVKMRAGWDHDAINAPELAQRVQDVGAAAVAVHGRTAAQSYSGSSDWELIGRVASVVNIPVLGSGDCIEASQVVERMRHSGVAGVLVGRGALRNPWIFEQAAALVSGSDAALRDRSRPGQVPPRVHRLVADRAAQRVQGIPTRRSRPAVCCGACARARSRPVGHQQAASAELMVHQGAGRRFAASGGDQRGRLDRAAEDGDRGVLLGRNRQSLIQAHKFGRVSQIPHFIVIRQRSRG